MPYPGARSKKATSGAWAFFALLALLLGAAPAQAQSSLDLYLRAGPSLSPLVTLQRRAAGTDAGFLLRMGILSGLPVQVEVAISRSLVESGRDLTAVIGVRLLPVRWSLADGFALGGGPGHNVGLLAGFALAGGYVGATYEWLVTPEAGLVAEVTKTFGGVLESPLSVNLGVKLQWPLNRAPP